MPWNASSEVCREENRRISDVICEAVDNYFASVPSSISSERPDSERQRAGAHR